MTKFRQFGFSALFVVSIVGCSTTSTKTNEVATESNPVTQSRTIAGIGDQAAMEARVQKLMAMPDPTDFSKAYMMKLYEIFLAINRSIDVFEKELDNKIAFKKANPDAEIEEPLDSNTYRRLLKLWILKDRYITEISYMYFRVMTVRTDRSLPLEDRKKARALQRAVAAHLKNVQNEERVELQEVMMALKKVHDDFVIAIQARVGDSAATDDSNAEANLSSFSDVIFKSQSEMLKYMRSFKNKVPQKISAAASVEREKLVTQIEKELSDIPEPEMNLQREPQSEQDLDCVGNKKLCASAGESGNIIGKIFPAGHWALTFDDGPAAKSTGDMMDVLKNYSDSINPTGKGTFFWLAKNVKSFPQWVQKAVEDNYTIANHSLDHSDLNKLNTANRNRQIVTSNEMITTEARKFDPNYKVQYFRCPYGSCYAPKIPEVRNIIANQGQIHVYWRIDSLDWKLLNGPKIAELVKKQMQLLGQGVILFHDIHPTTVDALKLVLAWVKTQNDSGKAKYKLVTIPEAVDLVNAGKQ